MKTIDQLKAISDSDKPYISKEEVHEIATAAVWFCSDSMDHFYCVTEEGNRDFGFAVFGQQRDGSFEVLIANPKVASVAEWLSNEDSRFWTYWSKARAEAIGHAVGQSLTYGYGLQDEASVSQGFIRSFCQWV